MNGTVSGHRTRTNGSQADAICNMIVYRRAAPVQNLYPTIGLIGDRQEMSDYVTPNFRKLVSEGAIINNPMTITKDSITRQTQGFTRQVKVQRESDDIRVITFSASPLAAPDCSIDKYGIDIEALISLACTRALGNIAPPDATSLLTLGELAETIALMRNPIDALTSAFKQLVKLRAKYWKLKAAGLSVTAVASQYLAVMFGMKPLLSDIQMFWKLLGRFVPPRRTARAQFERSGEWYEQQDYGLPFEQPLFGVTGTTGKATVTVRAGSLYQYELQNDYSSMFGVRLSDVPIAMWQLTGFSFLVDWALNVSSFIKALTPVAGVRRLSEWYTVHTVVEETVQLSTLVHASDSTWTGSGGGDTVTRILETYTRSPCNLGEHVGIHSNLAWSPTKTLLSLSLLTQAVAGFAKGKQIPLNFSGRGA